MAIWAMIPARGGSVGVPRKNVRLLGGRPLIAWAIESAKQVLAADHVVVITDDDEIAAVGERHGVVVLREPRTSGRATLDDVARKVLAELLERGAQPGDVFATVQPTCPFIRPERILEAAELLAAGAGSVLTVVDDRHLTWALDESGQPVPEYAARVNRQVLPPRFRETGGVIATTVAALQEHGTRIVQPVRLVEVDSAEALDIDNFTDWKVAEYLVGRQRVLIRCDAGFALGMGHAYRALALAQELAEHRLTIVISEHEPLSAEFFASHPFEVRQVASNEAFFELVDAERPDLVIVDQLDTTADYIRRLKQSASRVVTFEDLGPGAEAADLLVSELYENPRVPAARQLGGLANAILSPAFNESVHPIVVRPEVETVLVVFGGTDPSHLARKSLQALAASGFEGEVLVVRGLGTDADLDLDEFGLRGEVLFNVKHMPSVMQRADLALSSAGRTITELLSLGIPVVCLAQNAKEATHTHASAEFGVVNLGLGVEVTVPELALAISGLLNSREQRQQLHERALRATAGRSNAEVVRRILDA